jgi:hypothetical protein
LRQRKQLALVLAGVLLLQAAVGARALQQQVLALAGSVAATIRQLLLVLTAQMQQLVLLAGATALQQQSR